MIKGQYLAVLIFLITASLASTAPVFAQGEDAKCLATALMSEASVGTNAERVAVAWTIFNRVNSPIFPNTICAVTNQHAQYANNQAPTQEFLDLAESLIANPGTDPTEGATYFFSPRSMPKKGDDTTGYDIDGGLHDVAGIDKKVYFPSWTSTKEYVGDIPGVRPAYYMFYRELAAVAGASIGSPVTLTLYIHNGNSNGPVIPGAQVTGHDGSGNSFQVTTSNLGYVTITENPGTWTFTVSAPGFETTSWNQDITHTHAFHLPVQPQESVASATQGSGSSIVGTWNVVWNLPPQTVEFVVTVQSDGIISLPPLD
jgi:hypothetical protein